MTSKPIEVEAELIENAIEPVDVTCTLTAATIEDNIAEVRRWVESQIEPYQGWTPDPSDEKQIKEGRKCMADLNKIKKPIEDERKRIKNEYERPLREFEARVKEITSLIDEARGSIKESVDTADALFKQDREESLREEYEGVAGPIAGMIRFEALLDPKWLNRSTPYTKAANELANAAEKALSDYNILMGRELAHKDEVVRRFCETRELSQALAYEDELVQRDRKLEEWKAAQAEVEAAKARMAEPEEPEPAHEEPVIVWSLSMEFEGTRAQARKVADALRELGVTGATIKALREVDNG